MLGEYSKELNKKKNTQENGVGQNKKAKLESTEAFKVTIIPHMLSISGINIKNRFS